MPWKIGRQFPNFHVFLAGSGTYATKDEAQAAMVVLVLRGVMDGDVFDLIEVDDAGVQLVSGVRGCGQGQGVVPPDGLDHGLVPGGEVQAPDGSVDGA